VVGRVLVDLEARVRLREELHERVGDAVLRLARGLGDGAHGKGLRGREGVDAALEAGGDAREDDAHLPLEALRAAVNVRDDLARVDGHAVVVHVHEGAEEGVHPPPRDEVVEPPDDDAELLVEGRGLVLDVAHVRRDLDRRVAPLDEGRGDDGLGLSDVPHPEEELAVQVRQVDVVHVDHVDVCGEGGGGKEGGEGKGGQSTGARGGAP
jgi:hypothetical protein